MSLNDYNSEDESENVDDLGVITKECVKPSSVRNMKSTLSNDEIEEEVNAIISDEGLTCTKVYYNEGQVAQFAPIITEMKSFMDIPTHPRSVTTPPPCSPGNSNAESTCQIYLTHPAKFTITRCSRLKIQLFSSRFMLKFGNVSTTFVIRDSYMEVPTKSSSKYVLTYWICHCSCEDGPCPCPKPCGEPTKVVSTQVYFKEQYASSYLGLLDWLLQRIGVSGKTNGGKVIKLYIEEILGT